MLNTTLIGLADLVVAVENEGGSACPELPSFGTAVGEISTKVDLNDNVEDELKLVRDRSVANDVDFGVGHQTADNPIRHQ